MFEVKRKKEPDIVDGEEAGGTADWFPSFMDGEWRGILPV